MSEPHVPSWKFRLFRLRYVDYLGGSPEIGVRYRPREQFRFGDPEFRGVGVTIGRREFVFDLGKRRSRP